MAKPHEKLAASLDALKALQSDGRRAFRSSDIGRVHRERLVQNGFLREVIKGWLISTGPHSKEGDTTPWYASFWEFCALYCRERFGSQWHLSPEQSLLLHAEATTIPPQVIVYSPKGTNNTIPLLFGKSFYDLKQKQMPPPSDLIEKDGLRLFTYEAALIKVPEPFFQRSPVEAQVALASVKDVSGVLGRLLDGGHSAVAGRLAGAFRRAGRAPYAEEILKTMKGAGYELRESDPFSPRQKVPAIAPGIPPIIGRLQAIWETQRQAVIDTFLPALARVPAGWNHPAEKDSRQINMLEHVPTAKPLHTLAGHAPGLPRDGKAYMKFVEDIYENDAYHSLSIEGYSVTPELIDRVRQGSWNPQENEQDRKNRDAMAARGYWQAFQKVKDSVASIITGAPAGNLVRDSHREWYREMFQPSVAAGLLRPGALAGYRNHPVFIRGSRHVPPRAEAVPEGIAALFDLLQAETQPSVRAVLGHWLFGYIHPYPDGNGRMARFLMNAMLASGGYPWTVIRVEDRTAYMAALETASVDMDVRAFSAFISERVNWSAALLQ